MDQPPPDQTGLGRFLPVARPAIAELPASKIREIANAGFGRTDLVKFWFGESHKATPDYIRRAGTEALEAGEIFYTHNNGREDVRAVLAAYLGALHGRAFSLQGVSLTSSGVSALMIALQTLISPGDRVVMVTPVWPNIPQMAAALGADLIRVGLGRSEGRWQLDTDLLLERITPDTRAVIINSPGNPTGWIMPAAQQEAVLAHCRRLGVWILADDVYERLVLGQPGARAPSFLAIADEQDRLIGANSFSKAWLMTGWRLGWLVAPPALFEDIGKVIEFNTSCIPGFIQSAGAAALTGGEADILSLQAELTANRDLLLSGLRALGAVEAPIPEGGMYAFLRLAGQSDSAALARRLVSEAGLGLAPGAAFGPEGEGWLRWCLAASPDTLALGLDRFTRWARTAGI